MSELHIRHGAVAVRLRLFESPGQELSRTLSPPWPSWMRRLYELESMAERAASRTPDGEAVTMGAAVHALAERLRHRLDLIAFVVSALEDSGWEPMMDGDVVVASKVIPPALALEELEEAGVLGPMTQVCELDSTGLPRLYHRWDLG